MEFTPFPKIPRLSRDMVVTEKLDGTNASVLIAPTSSTSALDTLAISKDGSHYMLAGSRTRWLDTSSAGDNFGFAKWVQANAEDLFSLGPGHHFGEWWGQGIQRRYGLQEKRFSLFNVGRWYDRDAPGAEDLSDRVLAPACCRVVPILLEGPFDTHRVQTALSHLGAGGSCAAPGFANPEGVIVYHVGAGRMFKKTFEGDAAGKGG